MLHPRVRIALIALTACAVAAVAGVWIADSRDEAGATGPAGFQGSLRPPGAPAPPLTGLRDQDGEAVEMPRGAAVMTFVYSTCEDTCPTLVQTIRGALDDLGSDVPVIGVSVDPANDTPARARRFLLEQRMTGRMRFMLGSEEDLARVWAAYGIQPQHDGKEHSAYVVLTADGEQRLGYPVSGLSPEGLAHDLRLLSG